MIGNIHPTANWYRDLILVAVCVVLGLSVKANGDRVGEIQEGRKTTTGITCAVSAAVVKGGKLTIVSSAEAPLPPKLEAFLRRYEYPSKQVRREQARIAGQGYSNLINKEIIAASGVRSASVLEPDKLPNGKPNPNAGTLNCQRLRQLAKLK